MDEERKPVIKVSKDGPFIVKNLRTLRNSKGVFIETKPTIALCRCGESEKNLFAMVHTQKPVFQVLGEKHPPEKVVS
ncbi:MAG: hypothetical protein R2741_08600 [Methanolobus sp.]